MDLCGAVCMSSVLALFVPKVFTPFEFLLSTSILLRML